MKMQKQRQNNLKKEWTSKTIALTDQRKNRTEAANLLQTRARCILAVLVSGELVGFSADGGVKSALPSEIMARTKPETRAMLNQEKTKAAMPSPGSSVLSEQAFYKPPGGMADIRLSCLRLDSRSGKPAGSATKKEDSRSFRSFAGVTHNGQAVAFQLTGKPVVI